MKYLPFILLALLVYLYIRLENERAKTDAALKNLQAKIPNLLPSNVTIDYANVTPGNYLNTYLSNSQ